MANNPPPEWFARTYVQALARTYVQKRDERDNLRIGLAGVAPYRSDIKTSKIVSWLKALDMKLAALDRETAHIAEEIRKISGQATLDALDGT